MTQATSDGHDDGASGSIAPRAFRDAMSRFTTGVCVVTTVGRDGAPAGLTVSSLTSLSLEPPLILDRLGRKTTGGAVYTDGEAAFALNLLAEDQLEVSETFASQEADKFGAVAYRTGEGGCALLDGCLANLECTRQAVLDGGDHVIIVGRVLCIHAGPAKHPLLRYRGRYMRLGEVAVS